MRTRYEAARVGQLGASSCPADMTTVQDSLEKTKLLVQEQKDSESRANNIIIYNIHHYRPKGMDGTRKKLLPEVV